MVVLFKLAELFLDSLIVQIFLLSYVLFYFLSDRNNVYIFGAWNSHECRHETHMDESAFLRASTTECMRACKYLLHAKYNSFLPLDHPDRGTQELLHTMPWWSRYRSTSRRRCVLMPSPLRSRLLQAIFQINPCMPIHHYKFKELKILTLQSNIEFHSWFQVKLIW